MNGEKVMVLAPHPDDAIIGCGGSLVKHLKRNRRIVGYYMTSGENGSAEILPDHFTHCNLQVI